MHMQHSPKAVSNEQIALTIAVPAYNMADLIGICFQSLLNAGAGKSWIEILVVNDGSQDNTSAVVLEWAERLPNIRLVEQENQGLAQTRNVLIEEAIGDYVWFVDPDDTVTEDSIGIIASELELDGRCQEPSNPIDLLLFGFAQWRGDDITQSGPVMHVVPDKIARQLMLKTRNPVEGINVSAAVNVYPSACTAVVRRTLFTQNHIIYPCNIWYEDLAVKAQLVLSAKRLVMRDYVLYNYFDRPGSIMNTDDLEKNLDILKALNNVRGFVRSLVRDSNLSKEQRRSVYRAVDFLTMTQLMLSATQRIWNIDPRARQLKVLRENLWRMMPHWYRNPLFKQMPVKRRMLIAANAFGWHGAYRFVS